VVVLASYVMEQIGFGGIAVTGLLLLFGVLLKLTNGLFIARLPWDFIRHREDPSYEAERRTGKACSDFVFRYVPPFFLGFLAILILAYLL